MDPLQARDGLQKYTLFNTILAKHCPAIPKCNRHSKYRTVDGNCNNLDHPLWAKSLTEFKRIVAPAYADGINEFRISIDGSPLPKPRIVSLKVVMLFERN